ncbi:hypothetical protein FHX49_000497 [Microbacterium endophyticum]|uniref:Uncharacterized protein n=1 Tax=Microbacterium endophyticum TaxID=1526412 RepID=A0A7W4V155_9MICO|nr:hypothetical protein [Microbacterium endophyticum]MBB2974956.1 hypothetical protein [Microbacterium endophyticum]NIK37253.1 hypothetical protein [Microbacterium endophyticum]
MSVDWANYHPYQPPVRGLPHELTKPQAREAFGDLMRARSDRRAALAGLVEANSFDLKSDDESIQRLNDWYRTNVEPSPDTPDRLRNLWYAVVNDIALWLGDVIIERAPSLRWVMYTEGKRNISYQRHVLMGFRNVENPRFNVDVDLLVASYGHRVIKGLPVDDEEFVAVVHMAVANA